MKVKPQRRNASPSRTGRGNSSTSRSSGRRPAKKKKQDNTKLFIGLGVGAFFLLFVIIAAATSGGSSDNSGYSQTQKKSFSLPLSAKKAIYREYTKIDDKLEDQAADKISSLQGEELRAQGKRIRSEKKRLLQNAKVELITKYKKKYSGLTSSYVNKIINEGIDKNW